MPEPSPRLKEKLRAKSGELGVPLSGVEKDYALSREVFRLRVVTDNGSAFKSDAFQRFFRERPFLEHIRTRHYAPQTNGVVERFNQSLKHEHLYRLEIDRAWDLAEEVEAFLDLYNTVRPHEAIGFKRPLDIYLQEPHLFSGESVQET